MVFSASLSYRSSWTPASISTALWLDAADSSTISQSSGLVNQWNDKSGNSRHVASTLAARPTYNATAFDGLPGIVFNGTTNYFTAPNSIAPSSSNATFVVIKTNPGGSSGFLIGRAYNWGAWYMAINPSTTLRYHAGRNGIDEANASVSGVGNNVNVLCVGVYNQVNVSAAINGNSLTNTAYTPALTYNSNDQAAIGCALTTGGLTAGFIEGVIPEILVLHYAPSTETRQRIEGYLAHKWGLTANLPSNHPFKNSPPRGI